MVNTIDSASLLELQGANTESLGFSRTTGFVTTASGGSTLALSKTFSVTVTMADNVDLSDSAKAFLADLECGKLPDAGEGQSGTYDSLGITANQSRTTSAPHSSDVATSATTEYSVTDGHSSFTVSLTESTDVETNSRLLLLGMNSDSDDTVTISTRSGSVAAATSAA